MMYKDMIAAAIKVNGKVLRETSDSVFLPFGKEYSVLVKNLNSVRSLVRIWIDGTEVTGGVSLIIPANDSIELERFIENGNMTSGQRLKFIERTKSIEDGPRGIKIEDGLIRIEVQFEKVQQVQPQYTAYELKKQTFFAQASGFQHDTWPGGNSMLRSRSLSPGQELYSTSALNSVACSTSIGQASSAQLNDVGITVGGSVSDQAFKIGSWFPVDGVKHVLVLKIVGEIQGEPVKTAVTVKTKIQCPTCGTKNSSSARFCSACGTGLIKARAL